MVFGEGQISGYSVPDFALYRPLSHMERFIIFVVGRYAERFCNINFLT